MRKKSIGSRPELNFVETAKPAEIKRCETKTLGDILDLASGIRIGNRKGQAVFPEQS